jgi:hypothetical protein
MELKPVARYDEPRYPTHRILEDHPELLRLIPRRWQGNRLALAALGMAAGIVLGSQQASAQEVAATGDPTPAATSPVSMVAPLFLHGEGRGSTGCVVVNPPLFLSEEEGRAVIQEELWTVGLTFRMDNTTVDGFVPVGAEGQALQYWVPRQWRDDLVTQWSTLTDTTDLGAVERELASDLHMRLTERLHGDESRFPPEMTMLLDRALDAVKAELQGHMLASSPDCAMHRFRGEEWPARAAGAALDGRDELHRVSFEFVSRADYAASPAMRGRSSSVSRYRLTDLAEELRSDTLTDASEGASAVFYDPVTRVAKWDPERDGTTAQEWWETARPAALDRSRDDLRAQVRDFIEWLEAEGVI